MQGNDLYGGVDPRDIPNYSYVEAARLSGVSRGTLRSWVLGRKYPRRGGVAQFEPLIDLPHPDSPKLSYNNIIEAHVLSVLRRFHGLELKKVRTAIDYMKTKWGIAHPLTFKGVQTDGVDIFIDRLGDIINASLGGQMVFREAVETRLSRIDYGEDGRSIRLFPFVRKEISLDQPRLISIDPRVAFGKPVIAGTRIQVANIVDRWQAGDSLTELAEDYHVPVESVEEAIRFMQRAA